MLYYIKHEIIGDYVQQIQDGMPSRYCNSLKNNRYLHLSLIITHIPPLSRVHHFLLFKKTKSYIIHFIFLIPSINSVFTQPLSSPLKKNTSTLCALHKHTHTQNIAMQWT
jgi:hypothetical protein